MNWPTKLHEGIFLKRYKRFFADFQLQGQPLQVAHVPNTGSLKSVSVPGQPCLVSEASDPSRKLKFTLEAILDEKSKTWVGVNTAWPNKLVKDAITQKLLPHWDVFDEMKPEYKLNKETRLDFMLSSSHSGNKHFIEVKNVTLKNEDFAEFPDAVTERGQKHLVELTELVGQGHTAEIFFAIQRSDCKKFRPADEIDPEYGRLLRVASKAGVLISAFQIDINYIGTTKTGKIILTNKPLEVIL